LKSDCQDITLDTILYDIQQISNVVSMFDMNFWDICPTLVSSISLGQKWQRTHGSKIISCSQRDEATCTQGAYIIFLLGEGVCVEILLFLMCSHEVPVVFS
jgi:hypothetical protein